MLNFADINDLVVKLHENLQLSNQTLRNMNNLLIEIRLYINSMFPFLRIN